MELSNYQAFMECMRKWEKIGCNILCGLALWEQMQDCDRRGVPYTDIDIEAVSQELMTQDEIATMDGGMCILQLRGVRPFFSKKYDITKHPRYKYLSDADKKNTFDVERYIRVQRKKKKHPSAVIVPEEPFDLYEIELSDEDADFTVAE